MSTHIDRALRRLDAASPGLTDEQRHRADAHLERIVATPGSPIRRTVPRGRLVMVPAATLTLILAMGIVLLPAGGDDAAYASWTATPTAVAEADREAVATVCSRRLSETMDDFDRAALVLAERRGDHVALLYRTDDPDQSGSCLATIPPGSERVQHVTAGMGGSSGPALPAPPAGFTQGAIAERGGMSITDGAVGEHVVGVTIHAGDVTVETSVRNGRYVAWWPGPAFEAGPPQQGGRGGPEPILTYDLTLADGTVITDAEPTLPR